MNVKKGLFRLWLVVTVVWSAFFGWDWYTNAEKQDYWQAQVKAISPSRLDNNLSYAEWQDRYGKQFDRSVEIRNGYAEDASFARDMFVGGLIGSVVALLGGWFVVAGFSPTGGATNSSSMTERKLAPKDKSGAIAPDAPVTNEKTSWWKSSLLWWGLGAIVVTGVGLFVNAEAAVHSMTKSLVMTLFVALLAGLVWLFRKNK